MEVQTPPPPLQGHKRGPSRGHVARSALFLLFPFLLLDRLEATNGAGYSLH